MPYAKSAVYKAFELRLAGHQRTVIAAFRFKAGGAYNSTIRDAMCSSAILLGFAHFESYVTDVVDDLCKALTSAGKSSAVFSDDLRAHVAVAFQVSAWSELQDPGKLRKQIWTHKLADGFALLNDAAVPTKISSSAVLARIRYPKPDNIKKLLTRLGFVDPVASLGGPTVLQKLTSFHDVRAELAHTGKLPSWSQADYSQRLNEFGQFARAFDHLLWKYVVAIVPASRWIR
jgi:hypothetical protein